MLLSAARCFPCLVYFKNNPFKLSFSIIYRFRHRVSTRQFADSHYNCQCEPVRNRHKHHLYNRNSRLVECFFLSFLGLLIFCLVEVSLFLFKCGQLDFCRLKERNFKGIQLKSLYDKPGQNTQTQLTPPKNHRIHRKFILPKNLSSATEKNNDA